MSVNKDVPFTFRHTRFLAVSDCCTCGNGENTVTFYNLDRDRELYDIFTEPMDTESMVNRFKHIHERTPL